MGPLNVLSIKLAEARERLDAAFARNDGGACDQARTSADDILAAMAVFASRSLGDLAAKAGALGARSTSAHAVLSGGERALLISVFIDAQRLEDAQVVSTIDDAEPDYLILRPIAVAPHSAAFVT
jgi:hypothetical protein